MGRSMRRFPLNIASRIPRAKALSVAVLLGWLIVVLAGHWIRPDDSPMANQQFPTLGRLKPLSSVHLLRIKKNRPKPERHWWRDVMRGGVESEHDEVPFDTLQIQGHRLKVRLASSQNIRDYRYYTLVDVLYAVSDSTIRAMAAIEGDEYRFRDLHGNEVQVTRRELINRLPTAIADRSFLFGTDQHGRDLLSRIMAGAQTSLYIGFFSMLISLILGLAIGLLAGYLGGWIEAFLSWVINVFWSVPAVLLIIAISMILGKGIAPITVGIGMILWVEMAQVVKGEVRSLREREFIKAAHLMGIPTLRLISKHILPNVAGPVAVLSASNFAEALLLESGLSFLGVGVQPPVPSWGNIIRETYGYIVTDGAYLALIPGMAIVLTVLAVVSLVHNADR